MTAANEPKISDLAILVGRLVYRLRQFDPNNPTAEQAMDYLRRKDLTPSMLREAIPPQWRHKPIGNGWYFYADRAEDWDLARPVPVERIEYAPDTVALQAKVPNHKEWLPVEEIPGIWWGPFPGPPRVVPDFQQQPAIESLPGRNE